MKPIFLVLAWCCLLFPTVAHGNGDRTQKLVFSLSNNSVDDLSFSTVPCNSPGSDLAITDAEGELPMTGDNDPSNGAFMRWTATGGTGLYFSQIYQGGELYTIEDPGTGFTVFTANNGINFDEEVAISVELGGVCITPGFWTIRVWEVSDADNDRQPDRDVNGEILGCFVETTIEFFPSCPQLGTNVPFTVDPQDIGCNGTGGTIGLLNFQQDLMYCVDNNGGGATFDWVGPDGFTATTRDVANLVPGIYTVEVKDFYGCTFRWSREIVDLDNLAFDCRIVDSLSVFGASDAVIEVETTAGSGDYELSWTGPSSGNRPNIGPGPQTIENLPAGLYRFYVTDNISTCVDSCTVEIPVPPCLIDFTVVYDEMSQTVIVTPVDGTADFFLSYFGPTEAENIGPFGFEGIVLPESDFLLGNYVFVLSEANRPDCALSQTFFIPPECHIEAVVSASQPTCSGDSDGSIALTVTDNLGPITYNWDNDAFDGLDSVGNLAAGTYTVRISDSAECYLAPQVVVLADPPPVRVTILQVETGCSGEPTNALLATHSGAVGTVSYNWSVSAADTNRIEGLAVGNYSVTVTDENSCVGVGSFEVIDPAPLTMNCSAMDESIVGTFDGTITIQHSGGIPGVILSGDLGTFPLRPNVDTVFTGLAPGTYSFLLTNPNGCFTNCTAVVGPGQCVLEVSILPTQPDCNTATGSALAQPLNDNGPLAYTWSSGDSTAAVTGLLPGDYFLTVTDTFNCEATAMVTIEPFTDFPVVSFNMPTEACPNGCTEIEFTLSGLPPFLITYEVDRPGGPNVTGNFQLSASGIREFCPGEFGYTSLEGVNIFFRDITDGNGCRRRVNRLASINTYPIIVGQLDTTLCPGDTLDYFGTLFHENQLGAEVALPFPSSNGCDTSTAVSVTFFAPALGALDTTICLGDTLRYFDQVFHANRTTDDVVLPIPSSNGCDTTVRVSLDFFAPVSGTLDTMLCFGDTLRYGNEIFHASRPFGRVVLPGASSNGCDSTLNINLSFFPPARGNLNTTICANDTLRYFGEEFHLGRRFGEVLIPGASVNGCDSTVSVFVDVLQVDTSFFDTTICRIDTLVFHGEVFNVRRMTGTVLVPEPAVNGCDSFVTVRIRYFPQVFDVVDTIICQGDTFNFRGIDFDETVEDFYIPLPGESINGCDSLVAVNVTVKEPSRINLSGEGVVCPDGSLEVFLAYDGIVPANVILSDRPNEPVLIEGDTTILLRQVTPNTTLSIIGTNDGSECPPAFSGSIPVVATDLGVGIDITSGDGIFAISCADGSDGSVVAVPTGGDAPYSYAWNTGDTSPALQGLGPGEYTVEVTSNRGCQAQATIDLNSPDVMAVQLSELPARCIDSLPGLVVQDITGGVGSYVYQVTGDPGLQPARPLPDTLRVPFGDITFTLEDLNGCRLEQDFVFTPPEDGQAEISPRRSIIRYGDSVALRVFTDLDAVEYRLWPGPDSILPADRFFVAPEETTTYVVTVIDADGCEAIAMAEVVVDKFAPVYVPNVFSPNEDGTNDKFQIYTDQSVVSISNFSIHERWGAEVYRFPGPVGPGETGWGWDGRHPDGRLYEQHVYVFSVIVTFQNGQELAIKGDVLLLW